MRIHTSCTEYFIDAAFENAAGETVNVEFEVTGNKWISIVDPAVLNGIFNRIASTFQ